MKLKELQVGDKVILYKEGCGCVNCGKVWKVVGIRYYNGRDFTSLIMKHRDTENTIRFTVDKEDEDVSYKYLTFVSRGGS